MYNTTWSQPVFLCFQLLLDLLLTANNANIIATNVVFVLFCFVCSVLSSLDLPRLFGVFFFLMFHFHFLHCSRLNVWVAPWSTA